MHPILSRTISGHTTTSQLTNDITALWASGLSRQDTPDPGERYHYFTDFVHDSISNTTIYACQQKPSSVSGLHATQNLLIRQSEQHNFSTPFPGEAIQMALVAPIQSVIAVIGMNTEAGNAFLYSLATDTITFSARCTRTRGLLYVLPFSVPVSLPSPSAKPVQRRRSPANSFISSCSPRPDGVGFAVGAERGLCYQQIPPYGRSGQNNVLYEDATVLKCVSDGLSIDWRDQNTVVSGHRNGVLRMWDIRVGTNAAATSVIAGHPPAVAVMNLKVWDGNKMVCQGTSDTLCMHDLRFRREKVAGGKMVTVPFTRCQTYQDPGLVMNVGFDICKEMDVIAAAGQGKRVQLFNASTGEEVQSWAKNT